VRKLDLILASLLVPSLLLGASCTGKDKGDDTGKKQHADADTDTDADTDADADADADTDTDPNDLSSYSEYIPAEADALCALWEACGYLDDYGYADAEACKADVVSHLGADPCVDYDAQAARTCLQTEVTAAADCTTYDGSIPPVCNSVCPRPPQDDTGTPPASTWAPKTLKGDTKSAK